MKEVEGARSALMVLFTSKYMSKRKSISFSVWRIPSFAFPSLKKEALKHETMDFFLCFLFLIKAFLGSNGTQNRAEMAAGDIRLVSFPP